MLKDVTVSFEKILRLFCDGGLLRLERLRRIVIIHLFISKAFPQLCHGLFQVPKRNMVLVIYNLFKSLRLFTCCSKNAKIFFVFFLNFVQAIF